MGILTIRRMERNVRRGLRKARNELGLGTEDRERIEALLDSRFEFDLFCQDLKRVMREQGAPDPDDERPFLTWFLNVFIPMIIPLILKIFGV